MVARRRPRPVAEAYLRLRTLPAEQAQIDWAHFGKLTVGRTLLAAALRCGVHLGALTRGLTDLLDTHRAAALEAALTTALAEDSTHLADGGEPTSLRPRIPFPKRAVICTVALPDGRERH
jgi:hypothetical protein